MNANMLMALDVEVNLLGESTLAAKHRICITEVSLTQKQANALYSRQYHQVSCTVRVRPILKCICVLCSHFPVYTGHN
jgi:hypothetical protein